MAPESSSNDELHHPWMVAVWPGMGQVAVSAGYYLMSKLEMHWFAELSADGLFDIAHVEVKDGVIQPPDLPRSRFFLWRDPRKQRDLVLFIGEAQPPIGKARFCQKLMEFAKELKVERVVTFAAMVTQMHPELDSRVFCAATDKGAIGRACKELDLQVLESGQIGGLNGVLMGSVAEAHLPGACLAG